MSPEDRVFNRLRQTPLLEMQELLKESIIPNVPSMIHTGNYGWVPKSNYYNEFAIHQMRIQTLKENGWEFEEFVLASEKAAIKDQVSLFNNDLRFPAQLIERAKIFYPNAKFVEAHIDLGDDDENI